MSDQTAKDQTSDTTEPEAAADNVRKMDQAKKKVAAVAGEAREKFQSVAAEVGERFQQASARAQEEIRDRSRSAREAARERYQATSAQLQDGYARVRTDVDYMVDDVNDFVRQNPGTAILIAASAGFLLGLLFRPRRYRD